MYLQNRHVCVSTELNPSAETQRWPKVTWYLPPLPNEQTRVNGRGGDGPGAQGQRSNLDHELERKTSRRTRQRDTYEIALGKRPSPVGSLVLDAVGANSVRRKVRGSNLAQPVIPFRSATTLEHVLEFGSSRRTRQQGIWLSRPGRTVPCGELGAYANEARRMSQLKLRHGACSPLDHRLELENLPPTDSKPPMK